MAISAVARGPGYPLGAARRGIGWQIGRHHLLTLRATDGVLAIFGNDRVNGRQLPDLGAAQWRDIRQVGGQRRLAGRTLLRLELNRVMHLVGRDKRALVALVTQLFRTVAVRDWWECDPTPIRRDPQRMGCGHLYRTRAAAAAGRTRGSELDPLPPQLQPHRMHVPSVLQLRQLHRIRLRPPRSCSAGSACQRAPVSRYCVSSLGPAVLRYI
jgi:hypothetical protein